MRYMLLIYSNAELSANMTQADGEAMYADYMAFTEGIVGTGEFVAGDPLQGIETATTVRVQGGKTATTDGPFAETKEVLAGYYIVEASDLDRAIAIAAQIPGAKVGSVEVRPLQAM